MDNETEQVRKEQAPAAYDLHNQLIHAFRYAFRKQEGLLARVEKIAMGYSLSDSSVSLEETAVSKY